MRLTNDGEVVRLEPGIVGQLSVLLIIVELKLTEEWPRRRVSHAVAESPDDAVQAIRSLSATITSTSPGLMFRHSNGQSRSTQQYTTAIVVVA